MNASGIVWIGRALVLIGFLSAWSALVRTGVVDKLIFSTPGDVGAYLLSALPDPALWIDTGYTLGTSVIAFVIASVAGVATGLLFVQFNLLRRIFSPYLTLANSLPRVALAPLLIAWLGIGIESKIALGISVVYFVVLINTMAGADSIEDDWVSLSDVLGATKQQLFRHVTLPASVPAVFAGLKLGLIYSVLSVVVGEMLAGEHGLGQQIAFNSNTLQMDRVIGQLTILAVLTASLSLLMEALEKRLMRWKTG